MSRMSTANFLILIVVGVLFLAFFVFDFFVHLEKQKYFNNFESDIFSKLEVMIMFTPSGEKVEVNTNEDDEIKFFRDILVKNLRGGKRETWVKERKLYTYTVYIKFYNEDSTNVYFFEVFLDQDKAQVRPLILRQKGNKIPGGYSYNLYDIDYKFYDRILEMWRNKE